MSDFTCECWRCGAEFNESLPRVFCAPCRPIAADAMAKTQLDWMTKFYLEHPDFPMPGDTVRRRTADDDVFERSVTADLAAL